jgi:hypothetical protein
MAPKSVAARSTMGKVGERGGVAATCHVSRGAAVSASTSAGGSLPLPPQRARATWPADTAGASLLRSAHCRAPYPRCAAEGCGLLIAAYVSGERNPTRRGPCERYPLAAVPAPRARARYCAGTVGSQSENGEGSNGQAAKTRRTSKTRHTSRRRTSPRVAGKAPSRLCRADTHGRRGLRDHRLPLGQSFGSAGRLRRFR